MLLILEDQGLVGKRYEPSYRFRGMPMMYFLTPKGLQALRSLPGHDGITDAVIKNSYRDKSAQEYFIKQHAIMHETAHDLQHLYPGIKFFTKRDLTPFTHFPKQLPDGFLALKVAGQTDSKRFFIDYIADTYERFLLDARIGQHVQYFEEGGWDVTGSELPTMLLLCESVKTERKVLRQVRRKLYSVSYDDQGFYTTTLHALKQATATEQDIWTSVEDPEDILDLTKL